MFLESSFNNLYQSMLIAFPYCPKRQNATDGIIIKKLQWVPFVGMKTLFIKGLAQNEGQEYNTIILFRRINYDGKQIKIIASDGLPYSFDRISLENTDISVRCNCLDYRFRFAYYNYLDKSLYGNKPNKYESKGVGPPANPKNLPGLCKHLIKTMKILKESRIFLD